MIGSFGSLIFTTSTNLLRTFDNFQRTSSARWANQEIIGGKVKSQYLGPGQDSITFDMTFDVSMGLNPRLEIGRLTSMCRDGVVNSLIIGGLPFGFNKWYIEQLGQNWRTFDNRGNLLSGSVNVTLKEYI